MCFVSPQAADPHSVYRKEHHLFPNLLCLWGVSNPIYMTKFLTSITAFLKCILFTAKWDPTFSLWVSPVIVGPSHCGGPVMPTRGGWHLSEFFLASQSPTAIPAEGSLRRCSSSSPGRWWCGSSCGPTATSRPSCPRRTARRGSPVGSGSPCSPPICRLRDFMAHGFFFGGRASISEGRSSSHDKNLSRGGERVFKWVMGRGGGLIRGLLY